MNDEVEILDAQLCDAEQRIADLELHLLEVKNEWEELYPYEALEYAINTIDMLITAIASGSELSEATLQDLRVRTKAVMDAKMVEPEIFYLA